MKRNMLLLATALVSAALVGPVLAQGTSGSTGGNAPTGVATPGTAAPQATTAPSNTGTTGVAPTGSATTGSGATGSGTAATGSAVTRSPTTAPVVAAPSTMTQGVAVLPMDPMKIDHMSLRQGLRTSKLVGMTVVNSANETLGTIDDLIVMPNDTVTYAVLSVGGFLGMGAHYVVVPYANLEARDKQMHLPNASKESLKALPSFVYPT